MIELKIPIKAIGKARPRFNFKTKRTYTPEKTKVFEGAIKREFYKWYTIKDTYENEPLKCKIRAFYKIPTSYSKKKRNDCIGQPYNHKPDADNIAKAVLDALNGLAYKDDNQIVKLDVEKMYDEEVDRLEIFIEEWNK